MKKKVEELEELGAVVMLPDTIKESIHKQKQKEETAWKKQCENSFEAISIDFENMDLYMDSVVDACCKHGCVVEQDGHCEHGNPSVLLHHGLI